MSERAEVSRTSTTRWAARYDLLNTHIETVVWFPVPRDNSAMRGGSDYRTPLVFRSKVDGWFRFLPWFGVLVAAAVLAIPAVQGDRAALWFTPTLLLPAALPLWLLRTTDYTITDTHLRIRCGPFRWNVPLADVRAVRPTRNPLSSPALSLDRLRIEYSHPLAVMVSPDDKEGFLSALRTRAPGLARV